MTTPSAARASRRARAGVRLALALGPLVALATRGFTPAHAEEAAPQPPPVARVGPSADGHLGAWLLLGAYKSASNGIKQKAPDPLLVPPPDVDEAALAPTLGGEGPKQTGMKDPPRWTLAQSGDGAIDVKAALTARTADVIAYAAGTLHLARPAKLLLLLGTDDGVRVFVDKKPVFSRDEARPQRDDDDLVPLDLGAGDHTILLKLHQREGAWSFRARVVDSELAPPEGAWLALPGTGPSESALLAAKMSWVSVDRALAADGYAPKVTVRYPEGVPLGIPLRVTARLDAPANGKPTDPKPAPVFDVDAGEVPPSGELQVTLPRLGGADLPLLEDRASSIVVKVAGREVTSRFFPKKLVREVWAKADVALPKLAAAPPAFLKPDSLETMQLAARRLAGFVARGDVDGDALVAEAKALDAALAKVASGVDPYVGATGVLRMAYRSPVDDDLSEYGLYVPPGYKPGSAKKWPLIVTLHGLNGKPLAMIRYLFGGDDPNRENEWEDRHPIDPPSALDAFVVSPDAHGNAMYRDMGEDDVMRVLDRIVARYAIDETKVTITGPSMGGIGAAAIPLRHPDRFAAAEPLCGYHSYFVRRDFLGRLIRPWERTIAEERSNVEWALNGAALPLYIVHGTQDLPVENSQVLIDKYDALKYSVRHEHPNLGHNVWQTTYEDLKGAKWLLEHARDPHPTRVKFRTIRLRDGDDAWVHVVGLATPDGWGQIEARVKDKHTLSATTSGIDELRFDRDPKLVDAGAVTVVADGTALAFDADTKLELHKEGGAWKPGPAVHAGPWKRGLVTGPFRDVFHGNILFVWGASDPSQARANEEVARAFAAVRYGVHVKYEVVSDLEFEARGDALANARSLFLVGNARSNKVVRAFEDELPVKLDGDALVMGGTRYTGNQLGTAFVRPNPKRPDRYLAVVEGTSALGTWRALSLPDLVPDFVVWDERIAPARGQMLLSAGMVLAGGFFKNDWSLPEKVDDPYAGVVRPAAKTEHDATSYLP